MPVHKLAFMWKDKTTGDTVAVFRNDRDGSRLRVCNGCGKPGRYCMCNQLTLDAYLVPDEVFTADVMVEELPSEE